MGIFDKLKNALFEEEYVEVEEKPKAKVKKERIKSSVDEISSSKSEKPIAKKIVLPDKSEDYNNFKNNLDEEEILDDSINNEEKSTTFKLMDDNDFKSDDYRYEEELEPKIVRVIEKENNINDDYSNNYSNQLYQGTKKEEKKKKPYGLDEMPKVNVHQYGTYDKKDERGYFKPSPIISPIYGILDKNYKKDEIVTRKEVRLSSSYSRDKLNVDEVRKKAYGALEDSVEDVSFDDKLAEDDVTFEIEKDNLLVDLTSDDEKPSVKEVTMGDALEYFQDLGLEYNVDYVDATKKSSNRRVKDKYDEEEILDKSTDVDRDDTKEEIKNDVNSDDDNLFDLIDSMYKEDE